MSESLTEIVDGLLNNGHSEGDIIRAIIRCFSNSVGDQLGEVLAILEHTHSCKVCGVSFQDDGFDTCGACDNA